MGRKRISTTVYLEPDQVERLKEVSRTTLVPVSFYIRAGVDLVLAQLRREARIWDADGNVKGAAQ